MTLLKVFNSSTPIGERTVRNFILYLLIFLKNYEANFVLKRKKAITSVLKQEIAPCIAGSCDKISQ